MLDADKFVDVAFAHDNRLLARKGEETPRHCLASLNASLQVICNRAGFALRANAPFQRFDV